MEARRLAEEFLAWGCLLPEPSEPVQLRYAGWRRISFGWLAEGLERGWDLEGIQVSFRADVALTSNAGEIMQIPVIGGGCEFEVVLGGGGRVVAFTGAWRELDGASFESELIPRAEADELYHQLTACVEVESCDVRFAYYAAPVTGVQTFLYPVYVYRGWARFNGSRLPLLEVPLPATKFGPPLPRSTSES
jgi:hypothetical protein